MPLHQLIQFCHEKYNRPDRCDDCPNEDCRGNCQACLDHIHQIITEDRTYNCPNVVYYYTCHHIYRYSTEIEYLFNIYRPAFNNVKKVKMWSIGCGPACELYGLHNFKVSNKLGFDIEYKGFELNNVWDPIHEFINQRDEFHAEFYVQDFFNFIEETEEHPNIIVLSYLLSDILRTNREYINEFIENLCVYVGSLERAFLIINDINLGRNNNEARYYYARIHQRLGELINENNVIGVNRFHFENSQKSYFEYGVKHQRNQVRLVPIPEIIEMYNPWLECRSAQIVLFHKPNE